jgi:hypothetical protein
VFERAKTVHALDSAATVIGGLCNSQIIQKDPRAVECRSERTSVWLKLRQIAKLRVIVPALNFIKSRCVLVALRAKPKLHADMYISLGLYQSKKVLKDSSKNIRS